MGILLGGIRRREGGRICGVRMRGGVEVTMEMEYRHRYSRMISTLEVRIQVLEHLSLNEARHDPTPHFHVAPSTHPALKVSSSENNKQIPANFLVSSRSWHSVNQIIQF